MSQQIVQACHSALEAGLHSKSKYTIPSSIILLQTENEDSLKEDLEKFQQLNIHCSTFEEPYENMGLTSFATEPLTEDYRPLFREYKLWGRSNKNKDCPIVKLVNQQMKEAQKMKKESLKNSQMV